jgi:hypothetical protein
MDVATYEACLETLRIYDDSFKRAEIQSGEYTGWKYVALVHHDRAYYEREGALYHRHRDFGFFRDFAWHRQEIERPLTQLSGEGLQAIKNEQQSTLLMRKKTARGQLVELTNDADMFHSSIVKRLPLFALLALSQVCKATRDATNGHADWYHVVACAMADHAQSFRHMAMVDRMLIFHMGAVKIFFGIPVGWRVVPITYNRVGRLCGFEEHMRAMLLAKAIGPVSYRGRRCEVRRAALHHEKAEYRRDRAAHRRLDTLPRLEGVLSRAEARLAAATAAMHAFIDEHKLEMTHFTYGRRIKFHKFDVYDWKRFAGDGSFACPRRGCTWCPL